MKRPTWDELEKVVADYRCGEYLRKTPERYRLAMAIALTVARWRPERGDLRGTGANGLCAYDFDEHPQTTAVSTLGCAECIMAKNGQWCHSNKSLYQAWKKADMAADRLNAEPEARAVREAAADAMYNFLCELYKEEYDRC